MDLEKNCLGINFETQLSSDIDIDPNYGNLNIYIYICLAIGQTSCPDENYVMGLKAPERDCYVSCWTLLWTHWSEMEDFRHSPLTKETSHLSIFSQYCSFHQV